MTTTKKISLDNGINFVTADEAIAEIYEFNLWTAVVRAMDDETCERAHEAVAPCDELTFLRAYLELAPCDLCIG